MEDVLDMGGLGEGCDYDFLRTSCKRVALNVGSGRNKTVRVVKVRGLA